jgi:hypothetical protein
MKKLLFIFFTGFILVSCKKDTAKEFDSSLLLSDIKLQLKDSISTNDYHQLDFNNSFVTNNQHPGQSILKIPFKNKSIAEDFILLNVEKNNHFSFGKIINLTKTENQTASVNFEFYGHVEIFSLNRKIMISSDIAKGYVEAFRNAEKNKNLKKQIVVIPLMPDVVIICTYPAYEGGITTSEWYNLQSFITGGGSGGSTGTNGSGGFESGGNDGSGTGASGGYYSQANPYNNNAGNGGDNAGGGGATPIIDEPILIDYELAENLPKIDITKYLQCFSSVPDDGATCTIKILTDIPVDSDPTAFFDWKNGSPGHTFIQLTKVNGSMSVQQNIGFYPVSGWKNIISNAPVEGKFADNDGHEFNASLVMNLTPEKLKKTITHIQYLANFVKYDIDDYNCTDFALDVFNYQRGGMQLEIPLYNIPGGEAAKGTASPHGLYKKLITIKELGNEDSENVMIPGVKGFAGSSNGPCN